MSGYEPFDGSKFKVGDEVAISNSWGVATNYQFSKIDSITPKGQINVGGYKFRPDGSAIGKERHLPSLWWPDKARAELDEQKTRRERSLVIESLVNKLKNKRNGYGDYFLTDSQQNLAVELLTELEFF